MHASGGEWRDVDWNRLRDWVFLTLGKVCQRDFVINVFRIDFDENV